MSRFRVEVRHKKHIGAVTRVFRDGVEIPRVLSCEVPPIKATGMPQEISLTFIADEVVIDSDYNDGDIQLCAQHGMWYAKGCADCATDLDDLADDLRYTLTPLGAAMLEGKDK